METERTGAWAGRRGGREERRATNHRESRPPNQSNSPNSPHSQNSPQQTYPHISAHIRTFQTPRDHKPHANPTLRPIDRTCHSYALMTPFMTSAHDRRRESTGDSRRQQRREMRKRKDPKEAEEIRK